MDPAQFKNLSATLSPERFATYLAEVAADPARAIRLYTWNVELGAAFWGPLQALEICLRNALQRRMAGLFGRSDWWADPAINLHHVHREQVDKATDSLARRHGRAADGRVVSELSLGFWTGLLGKGNAYERRLWTPALRHAFPRYRGSRGAMHAEVERMRLLRNRIAHHEPIFSRDQRSDHDTVLNVAGWLDQDTRSWIEANSRVETVLNKRHDVVERGIGSGF